MPDKSVKPRELPVSLFISIVAVALNSLFAQNRHTMATPTPRASATITAIRLRIKTRTISRSSTPGPGVFFSGGCSRRNDTDGESVVVADVMRSNLFLLLWMKSQMRGFLPAD
jgi:hypothetical protein